MSFWETVKHVLILPSCLGSAYSCLECYVVSFRFEISSTQFVSVLQRFFLLQMLHFFRPSFAIKQKWTKLVRPILRLLWISIDVCCPTNFQVYFWKISSRTKWTSIVVFSFFHVEFRSDSILFSMIAFMSLWCISCDVELNVISDLVCRNRVLSFAVLLAKVCDVLRNLEKR